MNNLEKAKEVFEKDLKRYQGLEESMCFGDNHNKILHERLVATKLAIECIEKESERLRNSPKESCFGALEFVEMRDDSCKNCCGRGVIYLLRDNHVSGSKVCEACRGTGVASHELNARI